MKNNPGIDAEFNLMASAVAKITQSWPKLDFYDTILKRFNNKNKKHKVVLWIYDSRGQKN